MGWDDVRLPPKVVDEVVAELSPTKDPNVVYCGVYKVDGMTNVYKWSLYCPDCCHTLYQLVYGDGRPDPMVVPCPNCAGRCYLQHHKTFEVRLKL